jgi:hypothetical protein
MSRSIQFELPEGVNLMDAALIVHAIFEGLEYDYNNIATETGSNVVTVVGVEKKMPDMAKLREMLRTWRLRKSSREHVLSEDESEEDVRDTD